METLKCDECGAYKGHFPKCNRIDLEDAKRQLLQYYELWLTKELWVRERERRSDEWRKRCNEDRNRWRGKYNDVKHENNKLRKELYKRTPPPNKLPNIK